MLKIANLSIDKIKSKISQFIYYKNIRITVLTDSLFRIEKDNTLTFEDRASQSIINKSIFDIYIDKIIVMHLFLIENP